MTLVYIDESLMIDTDEINMVYRNGNRTDIFFKDGRMHPVWDKDKKLWNEIKQAIRRMV